MARLDEYTIDAYPDFSNQIIDGAMDVVCTMDHVNRQYALFMERMRYPSLSESEKANIDRLCNTGKMENIELAAQLLTMKGEFHSADRAFVALWMDSVATRYPATVERVVQIYETAAMVFNCSIAEACRDKQLWDVISEGLVTNGISSLYLRKFTDLLRARQGRI